MRHLTTLTLAGIVLLVSLYISVNIALAQQAPDPVLDWEVKGTAITQCQCTAYACPCRSNGLPTHDQCESVDFAYIETGHYGDISLDGLMVIIAGEQPSDVTYYFDQSSRPEQREAFLGIKGFMWSNRPRGKPAANPRTKVVPISYTESKDRTTYELSIPGILNSKVMMERDADGSPAHTVAALDDWGNTINYANSLLFEYEDADAGRSWDRPGHQSNVRYFHTTKTMWDNEELLMQHRDGSGSFTAKQREIIEKLGLKHQVKK